MSTCTPHATGSPTVPCTRPRFNAGPFFESLVSISLLDVYAGKVAEGHLERDADQEQLLGQLEKVRLALADFNPSRTSGARGWLRGPGRNEASVRGLYIWGSAGRGKTTLMDLFFNAAPVEQKSRVHFHGFMANVHAFIYAWRQARQKSSIKGDDPIAAAADAIAQKTSLLCFDEFNVTDIVDAMILGRLFEALFARGIVVVATSNVKLDELYQDGLNRVLFLPFIDLIKSRMDVVRLGARGDFRLEKLRQNAVYFVPADARAAAALTHAFETLTGAERGTPMTLKVLGRPVLVPEARTNVARFSFADLCQAPLGAADFLAIAHEFHTVLLDRIPIIDAARRDEAKRFITLIDTFYDRHVKLIASAEAEPAGLYTGTEGHVAFEFKRTASRLMEMRSVDYLGLPHGPISSRGSGDASGLVET
jgi:cell division protein ZapE